MWLEIKFEHLFHNFYFDTGSDTGSTRDNLKKHLVLHITYHLTIAFRFWANPFARHPRSLFNVAPILHVGCNISAFWIIQYVSIPTKIIWLSYSWIRSKKLFLFTKPCYFHDVPIIQTGVHVHTTMADDGSTLSMYLLKLYFAMQQ